MTGLTAVNWRAIIGFQLCWFALVFYQNTALVPVVLYWLYGCWRLTNRPRVAVILILTAGLLIDVLLVYRNVLQFQPQESISILGLPLWFIALWAVFALAAVEFMASVLKRFWLAAILGGIGGPLSYYSGAALSGGALQFPSGMWSAITLVVVWAAIAVLLGQSRRLYVKAV